MGNGLICSHGHRIAAINGDYTKFVTARTVGTFRAFSLQSTPTLPVNSHERFANADADRKPRSIKTSYLFCVSFVTNYVAATAFKQKVTAGFLCAASRK